MADAAGVQATLVHVASDTIAPYDAELGASLLGDRTHSVIFDNTKVKSLVPDYVATIPFVAGARDIVEWYDADPRRRTVDADLDAMFDKLVAAAR